MMAFRLLLAAFLAASLSTGAAAAQPKVLLCGAGSGATTDLHTKLVASGAFAAVDEVDCSTTTPSLAALKRYDAVEVSSNNDFQNRSVLGDNLADYVDAGGGVVLMMFTMFQNSDLLGRWATGSYSCILTGNFATSTTSLKATPTEPASPLVQGVTGITTSYRSLGALNAAQGAVSVWEFNDGVPAVCRMNIAAHRRVDLNFSPIPSWTADTVTGDAALLVKNALLYVSSGLAPAPSPLKLNSPAVGTSVVDTVNLYNRDPPSIATAITGAAITVNGAEFSVVSPASFPFGIVSGSHVPFFVHFTPTQTGVRLGELTITTSDPSTPTIRVPLQGNCGPPAITLSTNNLVFATTDIGSESSAQQVDISNTGLTDLVVYAVALTLGGWDFSVDATNVVSPLAPGASTSFSVRFAPSTAGPLTGEVVVASNDPAAANKVVSLSGIGRDPDAGADAMTDASSDGDAADGSTSDTTESDAGAPDAPGIVDTRSEDAASEDTPDASIADTVVDGPGPLDARSPDASSPDGSTRDARDAVADLSADSPASSDGPTSDAPRVDTTTRDAPDLDASRDGSGGSGGRLDAASDGSDGSDGTVPSDDDRGCGCRVASGTSTRASKWSMLFIVAAAALRKRARRVRKRD